jgi:hypothetical protein
MCVSKMMVHGAKNLRSIFMLHEREQVRKTRTASEERLALLRAVMIGVAVQALEVVLVGLVVLRLLGLI